jgi:membrane-associated phospholipid phosphatase
VLIHQHYLADLAGGLTLAALACVVSLRLLARDRGAAAG